MTVNEEKLEMLRCWTILINIRFCRMSRYIRPVHSSLKRHCGILRNPCHNVIYALKCEKSLNLRKKNIQISSKFPVKKLEYFAWEFPPNQFWSKLTNPSENEKFHRVNALAVRLCIAARSWSKRQSVPCSCREWTRSAPSALSAHVFFFLIRLSPDFLPHTFFLLPDPRQQKRYAIYSFVILLLNNLPVGMTLSPSWPCLFGREI